MTALVGGEVEVTFSKLVRWLSGQLFALTQPDQAASEDGADLMEVGPEIRGRLVGSWHDDPSRIVLLVIYRSSRASLSRSQGRRPT
ncbi:MAG: hypothetical protein ABS99_00485 [Acetobacteraceae bacterium SCN 69-10]|nr:hypothetical protein [Rhodospirillales bacterium]ODU62463.1 MAG: hypothetical protein ABS99_00485 [Acetobacteraceae bacterium SCN 69-10]OJY71823.1 MAG: hypothetical protein BGP12_09510 [Rhodospirillales bacterium 70-18]